MKVIRSNFIFVSIFLFYQFVTRVSVAIFSMSLGEMKLQSALEGLAVGVINDLVALSYILPVVIVICLIIRFLIWLPAVTLLYAGETFRPWMHRADVLRSWLTYFGVFLTLFLLNFNLIGELGFWDEFSTRYNFIAVDYIVYTTEIIRTIKESMPVIPIIGAIAALSLLIFYAIRRLVFEAAKSPVNIINNLVVGVFCAAAAYVLPVFYSSDKVCISNNMYVCEMTKNGLYEFGYAFFHNSLDYKKFYPTLSYERVRDDVSKRRIINTKHEKFNAKLYTKEYLHKKKGELQRQNVVLIVVESLSADFMDYFSQDKKGLTPYLDNLANDGIFFTNLYATGTRTVRGLEALTLSVPPTPGSAILRRSYNENLYSVSTILSPLGYNMDFIYGGAAYFDNMKYFFENNGFAVSDIFNLSEQEKTFYNAWGAADENSFDKALKIMDSHYAHHSSFFSLIMTTSNHRPYTFPEGKINLEPGSRAAAVKYTDYAIGRFIEMARKKHWFDDTIFVIIADHCASSAGKMRLPIHKYHIPMIIYAPKMLLPKKIETLTSQIDVVPTILGLMDIRYDASKFFGVDAIAYPPHRAFISTYQLLGYMNNSNLAILSPKGPPKLFTVDDQKEVPLTLENSAIVEEAIGFYQTAYDEFQSHVERRKRSLPPEE